MKLDKSFIDNLIFNITGSVSDLTPCVEVEVPDWCETNYQIAILLLAQISHHLENEHSVDANVDFLNGIAIDVSDVEQRPEEELRLILENRKMKKDSLK